MDADNSYSDVRDRPEGGSGHERAGLSRRDVMRRGAVLGGAAVWAAPTVQSLGMRAAFASSGTPCCHGKAFGLFVEIPGAGIKETFGEDTCVFESEMEQVGDPPEVSVKVEAVCGHNNSEDPPCEPDAHIAVLDVDIVLDALTTLTVDAEVLTSTAQAPCRDCDTRGDADVTTLKVQGLSVTVDSECNFDVLAALGLDALDAEVIFNRQQCDGETLSVDALFIHVPGVATIIASHSEAGAMDCPCEACAA